MSTSQYTLIHTANYGSFAGSDSPPVMSPLSPATILSLQQPSATPIFVDTSQVNSNSYPSPQLAEIKSEPMYSPASSPASSVMKSAAALNGSRSSTPGFAQMGPPVSGASCRQKPQDELCLVCGDRASGYHYNALACEGCKGFFRRSITQSKSSKYVCKYGDECEIDMYMRRKCQACRLKKCYTVGMRADCVVPEEQCRRKRIEKKKNPSASAAKTGGAASGLNQQTNALSHCYQPHLSAEEGSANLSRDVLQRLLKPEQRELINRLVYFQEEFEHPSEEDLKRVYYVPMPSSDSDESEGLFRHITEMTILTVNLIVEFSRHLPGFQTLSRADQVILLKACSSEVMMIRASRRYDIQTDSIIFSTNQPFTRLHYEKAGLENELLFQFCRRMAKFKVDNAEYGLITAITIFSERKNLCEPKRVEKIQEIYVDALQAYMQVNRRHRPMVALARLLSILTDLRSLGNNNSRQCFDVKLMGNRKLPHFLAEIWDIK